MNLSFASNWEISFVILMLAGVVVALLPQLFIGHQHAAGRYYTSHFARQSGQRDGWKTWLGVTLTQLVMTTGLVYAGWHVATALMLLNYAITLLLSYVLTPYWVRLAKHYRLHEDEYRSEANWGVQ